MPRKKILFFFVWVVASIAAKGQDIEQQRNVIHTLNRSAVIYGSIGNYSKAYELFVKALHLSEAINDTSSKAKILLNIGNIYYLFDEYDRAKQYYSKTLSLFKDTTEIVLALNNLGASEIALGNLNDAFDFLNKAMKISQRHNDIHLHDILHNFALIYKRNQLYDSAYLCYKQSLVEAKKNDFIQKEAEFSSDLGNFFLHINEIDSALFYIELSNSIAQKHSFLNILSNNYLFLSNIEKAKGRYDIALDYFEKYTNLKDSISGAAVFGNIKQLQYSHEISILDQQIDRFVIEQQIKERTIFYQKIGLVVSLLVCCILLFVYFQKRQLDTAYRVLFEKNMEIINSQSYSSKKVGQYIPKALKDDAQNELLNRILASMEDTSLIYDTEFSIDKLAELVQSNQKYVSQVINDALKKNFRSFLNSYRIREAQRLFSESDASKYTIEAVAFMVGFKSRTTFNNAFKEIVGVSPNFYLKSMQK
jgi:AraC-like DNA-binding protein/Tfp pilus assembly protein PilF